MKFLIDLEFQPPPPRLPAELQLPKVELEEEDTTRRC